MSALAKSGSSALPSVFDDFFKPWNEWFTRGDGFLGRSLTMPSVNITEDTNGYNVSLAAPGLKREDFTIDISGNMITVSSERKENKEEKEKKFTRREYNYTSFSRSFTLPDDVNSDKIEAKYADGILHLSLPRKDELKNNAVKKQIKVA
ncbi:MAG TPA: Hsp20/alpha crystallin family protein [Agriterribacter sp.]|nr:Hsp20/alpha crystallin family protein [Agriterribacter sp.]HRQ50627.1 Hsp20/alpha crystallin family protein [Agriterribacter sp.]